MVNAVLEKSCPCKDIVCLSASKIKVNAVREGKKNIYINNWCVQNYMILC